MERERVESQGDMRALFFLLIGVMIACGIYRYTDINPLVCGTIGIVSMLFIQIPFMKQEKVNESTTR